MNEAKTVRTDYPVHHLVSLFKAASWRRPLSETEHTGTWGQGLVAEIG